MSGTSYIIAAASVAYALCGNPIEIILAMLTANLPTRMTHLFGVKREHAHEAALWSLPMAVLNFFYASANLDIQVQLPFREHHDEVSLAFLFVGPVVHLLLDAVSDSGIRFASQPLAWGLVRKGTASEIILAYGLALMAMLTELVSAAGIPADTWPTRMLLMAAMLGILYFTARQMSAPGAVATSAAPNPAAAVQPSSPAGGGAPAPGAAAPALAAGPAVDLPPPEADPAGQDQEAEPAFDDPILDKAWAELVTPYKGRLKKTGAYEICLDLFKVFKTIGHKVSSIYGQDKDRPGLTLNDFELLKGTSLIEHSLHVARIVLKTVQATGGAHWIFKYPSLLVAALAHDLAKSDYVRSLGFRAKDHAANSNGYLNRLIMERHDAQSQKDLLEKKESPSTFAIRAKESMLHLVRHHHYTPAQFKAGAEDPTLTPELQFFQACDQEARTIEKDIARNKVLNVQRQAISESEGAVTGEPAVDPAPNPAEQPKKQPKKKPQVPPKAKTEPAATPTTLAPPQPQPAQEEHQAPDLGTDPPVMDEPGGQIMVGAPNLVMESNVLGDVVRKVQFNTKDTDGGKEEVLTRVLPDKLVSGVLNIIRDQYCNRLINQNQFLAFSQPDGFVYCMTNFIYDEIRHEAEDLGLQNHWYHEVEYRKAVLLSFYDRIRELGYAAPERLIGRNYFAQVFHFWNSIKDTGKKGENKFSHGYFTLIAAEAFGKKTEELERERRKLPILSTINAKKGPPPEEKG